MQFITPNLALNGCYAGNAANVPETDFTNVLESGHRPGEDWWSVGSVASLPT